MHGRRSGQDGMVTAFVTVTTVAMLMAAGLVLDGGELLAARREATARAEQAARAGAQAIDEDALRSRERRLEPAAAAAAAHAALARAGVSGVVGVDGEAVRVEVRITRRLGLLRLVGISEATVTGSGSARPVRGVVEAET